jgi:hypothetical protein
MRVITLDYKSWIEMVWNVWFMIDFGGFVIYGLLTLEWILREDASKKILGEDT